MIALVGGLVWYAGINTVITIITKTNPTYFLCAILAYFTINVLFTVRIIRVLGKQGIKVILGRKTFIGSGWC